MDVKKKVPAKHKHRSSISVLQRSSIDDQYALIDRLHSFDEQPSMINTPHSPPSSELDMVSLSQDSLKSIKSNHSQTSLSTIKTLNSIYRPHVTDFLPESIPRLLKNPPTISKKKFESRNSISIRPGIETSDRYSNFGFMPSKNEIQDAVRFVKFCSQKANDPIDDDLDMISFQALETAFRKYKKAKCTHEEEEYARELMVSLEFLLQENNLTIETWFILADTLFGAGGGQLIYSEIVRLIDLLCDRIDVPRWDDSDLNTLIKYMDSSSDNNLSQEEIELAMKKFKYPALSKEIIERAGPVIAFFQDHLREESLRLVDLFNLIDSNRDGSLSTEELTSFFQNLCERKAKLYLQQQQSQGPQLISPGPDSLESMLVEKNREYQSEEQIKKQADPSLPSESSTSTHPPNKHTSHLRNLSPLSPLHSISIQPSLSSSSLHSFSSFKPQSLGPITLSQLTRPLTSAIPPSQHHPTISSSASSSLLPRPSQLKPSQSYLISSDQQTFQPPKTASFGSIHLRGTTTNSLSKGKISGTPSSGRLDPSGSGSLGSDSGIDWGVPWAGSASIEGLKTVASALKSSPYLAPEDRYILSLQFPESYAVDRPVTTQKKQGVESVLPSPSIILGSEDSSASSHSRRLRQFSTLGTSLSRPTIPPPTSALPSSSVPSSDGSVSSSSTSSFQLNMGSTTQQQKERETQREERMVGIGSGFEAAVHSHKFQKQLLRQMKSYGQRSNHFHKHIENFERYLSHL